jgi:hypothetical protein
VILRNDIVGNDAGWHLLFFTQVAPGDENQQTQLSIGAGDYYAEIDAVLPTGLQGGTYRFNIEGITNGDYKQLHDIWSPDQKGSRLPLYVDLYLYWRDTGGPLGYLTSVAGLTDTIDSLSGVPDQSARVARLIVTKVSRRVGARRFEAAIEARERVYDALGKLIEKQPEAGIDPLTTAANVANPLLKLGMLGPAKTYPLAGSPPGMVVPKGEQRTLKTGLQVLFSLEDAMVVQARRAGRGMYLIRDGELHMGPGRIPLALASGIAVTGQSGGPKALDDAHGLVHVETTGLSLNEKAPDPVSDGSGGRLQYSLTLKGRPDLRPGDKVTFADPFTNPAGDLIDQATSAPSTFGDALASLGSSVIGAIDSPSGSAVELYVSSVSHRLSRSEGFMTIVAGVRAPAGEEWDTYSLEAGVPPADPAATPHVAIANAFQALAQSVGPEPLTVGEVRAANSIGTGEPPGQTVDVWLGQVAGDGAPHGARRLDIVRDAPSRLNGLPYLTPFAWGKAGLVLPRYPGTRVLVGHAGGSVDDAIEVGALWESGHGPESQAGDWWLILPAAVEASGRQSVEDGETPQEPSQKATNDLIDADGARVIEVGRLTVRVQPGKLSAPGTRPAAPDDSAEQVTIEHESGSRIVIKDNGDIVIDSKNDLTISAKSTITLEADDVRVKVTNTMDVGDR